ncbi:MAG: hypothetical protein ABFS16_01260 [Bacteroidota bacterium]
MRELILKNRKYLFLSVILLFLNPSCDEIDSQIPDVPFSFTINLNIYNELTIPGNSVYFPGMGFGGVIVYCELPGTYYAYDAACTYEISQNCKVENDGVLGTCNCCGSKFILIGTAHPSEGPAAAPLRQYHISVINNYTLRVYN